MIAANESKPVRPKPVRPKPARQLTGRTVLFCLLGFFGTVTAVNAIMIRQAVTTFGGLETSSAYKAGQKFEREIAAARAQEQRQWRVSADVRRTGAEALVEIDVRDAAGLTLAGLRATAELHRPTNAREDHKVSLSESAPGRFVGTAVAAPGQWDVLIEVSRGAERMFRSRNRVVLQ
jgi:nitrogen fixation protein FixH